MPKRPRVVLSQSLSPGEVATVSTSYDIVSVLKQRGKDPLEKTGARVAEKQLKWASNLSILFLELAEALVPTGTRQS